MLVSAHLPFPEPGEARRWGGRHPGIALLEQRRSSCHVEVIMVAGGSAVRSGEDWGGGRGGGYAGVWLCHAESLVAASSSLTRFRAEAPWVGGVESYWSTRKALVP